MQSHTQSALFILLCDSVIIWICGCIIFLHNLLSLLEYIYDIDELPHVMLVLSPALQVM